MTSHQTSVRRLAPLGAPPAPSPSDALLAFHADALDAVLWDGDLERVAALAAAALDAPVAIAVPHLQMAVLAPADDALRAAVAAHVGDRVSGRPARVPERVLAEAPIARRGEPLGAVLALDRATSGAAGDPREGDRVSRAGAGQATPAVPAAAASTVEILRLTAAVALTHVAAIELRASVEHELHGALIEQLRADDGLDPLQIAQRAARLGCDLSRGAVALCLRCEESDAGRAVTLIARELPGALIERVDEQVLALLPTASEPAALERVRRLVERLRPFGVAGLSQHVAGAGELRRALEEAELALELQRLSSAPIDVETAMSGTYRLLFRLLATYPDEVRALYEGTVAVLARYDEHHRTDLIGTLDAYLELNGNMNATAAKIFAHRHTVAYRLDRIRELTGLDPAEGEHRERLGLGLKAHRLLHRGRRQAPPARRG